MNFYVKGMLGFVKGFLYISQDSIVIHVLGSVYVTYYFDLFEYVEPSVHPWNEANLILIYGLCNMSVNLWESSFLSLKGRAPLLPSASPVLRAM